MCTNNDPFYKLLNNNIIYEKSRTKLIKYFGLEQILNIMKILIITIFLYLQTEI